MSDYIGVITFDNSIYCRSAVCFQALKMRSCFFITLDAVTATRLSISTIYPKSPFCTKWHKRLVFQGFSGVFTPLAQKAEKRKL